MRNYDAAIQKLDHAGKLVEQERGFRGKCKCGWYGARQVYRYEASQDLYAHFRERGTMPEPNGRWTDRVPGGLTTMKR